MNENELIDALENIMDAEYELRKEIERLSIMVKSGVLSKAQTSGNDSLQDRIVSSLSIEDFGSFEVEDTPLTKEELEKRQKARENFDFTSGIKVNDNKLPFDEMVDRFYARKEYDFEIGNSVKADDKALSQEELDRRASERDEFNFLSDNTGVKVDAEKLSGEILKENQAKRKKYSFTINKDEGESVKVDDTPISKEEQEAREKSRNEFDFTFGDSIEVNDSKLDEKELANRNKKRSQFDFTSSVKVKTNPLSEEELNSRKQQRDKMTEKIAA